MNIIIARKPLEGNCVGNVLKHGTGGICIDKCRVETEDSLARDNTGMKVSPMNNGDGWNANSMVGLKAGEPNGGRFPANIIHDGSEEIDELFPETAPSKSASRGNMKDIRNNSYNNGVDKRLDDSNTVRGHTDDGGSASRFFYNIGES